MTNDNVVDIPTVGNKMIQILKDLKRNLDVHIEYVKVMSTVRKAKYDSLVKEGFTPEQALELCKGEL